MGPEEEEFVCYVFRDLSNEKMQTCKFPCAQVMSHAQSQPIDMPKRAASAAQKASQEPASAAKPSAAKKQKVSETPGAAAATAGGASLSSADVVITSSKACQAFKTRANGLHAAIKKVKPSASVVIVEEKKLGSNPDRGSFVINVKGAKMIELSWFSASAL